MSTAQREGRREYVPGEWRDFPRATGPYRAAHAPQPRKPMGLDWDALRPTCTGCGEKSGQLNDVALCPACVDPNQAVPTPSVPAPAKPRKATTRRAASPPKPKAAKPRRVVRAPRQRKIREATAVRRELEATLVREYLAGTAVSELAAKHGRQPQGIRRLLDRNGVVRRDDRKVRSGGKPREYDETTMADVRRLYVDEQLSRYAVAAKLGLPYKTVVTIMAHLGVPARMGQSGRGAGAIALKARITDLGVSPREIKEWGIREGHLLQMAPGIPPARVVEAYAVAHSDRQSR